MKNSFGVFALSAALAINSNVNAEGFDGAQVTATAYCCTAPTEADRISVPLTKTVGAGTEFPSGSLQQTTGRHVTGANIDIGNSTIDTTYTEDVQAASGSFNGIVLQFSDPNLPDIVDASLDPLSTFTPSQIKLSVLHDSILWSAAGLHFSPGARILIDVAFVPTPVPEPETYAMLLTGLGLLGFIARRRKISST
jgi:hypothetical protein